MRTISACSLIAFQLAAALAVIAGSPLLELVPNRLRDWFATPYWRHGIYKPWSKWDCVS